MAVRFRRFDGKRVSRAWFELLTAARSAGVEFVLNSGKRTLAEQLALFRQNMIRPGVPKPGRPLTAVPSPLAPHIRTGRIDHAVDVNDENLFAEGGGFERLQDWASDHGVTIRRTVASEAWHGEASADQLRAFARKTRRARRAARKAERQARALQELKRKARAHGARYVDIIIGESRRVGVPVALGFALIEQETGFRNVFGHDPTIFAGAGEVTEEKYKRYKRQRGPLGKGGMQGVGPAQLTWFEFQDRADQRGGCWKPEHNIAVGLEILAANITQHGRATGIARYNGSGPAAERYSREVRAKQAEWRERLA